MHQRSLLFCLLTVFFEVQGYYHLTWVTDNTRFPITFSYKTKHPHLYGWFKHLDEKYIEDINAGIYEASVDEATGMNVLKIYNYDYDDDQDKQVDHYRLQKRVQLDEDEDDSDYTDEYIFSLGRLKDYHIHVHETYHYLKPFCMVRAIIPYGLTNEHTQFLVARFNEEVKVLANIESDVSEDDDEDDDEAAPATTLNPFLTDEHQIHHHRDRRFLSRYDPFERYVFDIQLEIPAGQLFRYDQDDDIHENVTCKLTIKNPRSNTVESISKILEQHKSSRATASASASTVAVLVTTIYIRCFV